MGVKKEYVYEIYDELKDEILECKKKVVSLYKKKLESKGYKFYVEFIDKNPVKFELSHSFIVKHLDTDKWIYINCHKNDSIQYNGKEYKTFHTIDIKKIGDVKYYDLNRFGYKINEENELKPLTDDDIDKLNGVSNNRGYHHYLTYDPVRIKENYYVKDYSRGYKLANFFDSIEID